MSATPDYPSNNFYNSTNQMLHCVQHDKQPDLQIATIIHILHFKD